MSDKDILARILAEQDTSANAAEVATIVGNWKRAQQRYRTNILTKEEFEPFVFLFSNEFKLKLLNNELTPTEQDQYAAASAKLLELIDPYKPFKVVNSVTGELVYPEFPPIYRPLNHLAPRNSEIMNRYNQAYMQDDGNANGVTALKQKQATQEVAMMLFANQSVDKIRQDRIKYAKSLKEIRAVSSGKKQLVNKQAMGRPVNTIDNNTGNPVDDFDFDL